VKQGNKKEMVFIKGKQSWKILSMTTIKGSGNTVDKQLLHALYQALDTRISALNNKDMELFATVLSQKLPNKNAIIEDLKKSITAFKDIVYILVERHPVEISDTKATVVQNYEMRLTLPDGTQQKLPAMAEKLTLEPNSSGVWQIVGGLK
jgi:ribosomal protein S13